MQIALYVIVAIGTWLIVGLVVGLLSGRYLRGRDR